MRCVFKALNWSFVANLQWDSDASYENMMDALLMSEGGAEVIISPEEIKQSVEYSQIKREIRCGIVDKEPQTYSQL